MIAIIIVGFNSQSHINLCLDSIYQSSLTDFRVIFVDNKSTDQTLEVLSKDYPQVIQIANPANYGFAKANNIGIEKALELGAEAVMLLNPDTAIDPDCLKILAEEHDNTSVLQPAILLDPVKKTGRINTTGGVLGIMGFSYCSDYQQPLDTIKHNRQLPIASGAAMYIPSSILKAVGSFDETFFMYHEDVDLAWRIRLYGYSIRLITQANVWHDYRFGRNAQKLFQVERNRLLFMLKNFSTRYLILLSPLFIVTEIAICLYFVKDGQLATKLRTYQSLIRLWPSIMKMRQKIQHDRKKTDRELADLLADRVQFSEMAIPLLAPYNVLVSMYWRVMRVFL